MFVNDQPDAHGQLAGFGSSGHFVAQNPPNGFPFFGQITRIQVTDPGKSGQVAMLFGPNNREEIWNYTFNKNNGFKQEYVSKPGKPNPPELNELYMHRPGIKLLYAYKTPLGKTLEDVEDFREEIKDIP